MQITRRMALSAALVSLWLQALPAAAADTATAARRTVVYHIDDSQRAIPMIRSVGNHRRADAEIRIIVVALSAGVDFLVEGAADDRGNTYDALVDPLMLEGVEFRVCGNTLKGRQIDAARLLPDVTVVPSGVAEIARLQIEEGAAYIKP
jgi:intracellular sulfur oxidation DsrE/DsrF family protein